MASADRLESLKRKHRQLEDEVRNESRRPLPDSTLLRHLKREKLKLKDEMARLGEEAGTV